MRPVKTQVKIEKAKSTAFEVSAYLIYDDGSLSSFDVLNDTTKALWNTIIGAGDAEKPSTSTQIRLNGGLEDLRITVFNGKEKIIDQALPSFTGDYKLRIKNTGCEIVKVTVVNKNKTVFKGTIPFHCGE